MLNRRVVLHAIDATPARWRGDADSSPLDRASAAASSPRNDLGKNCRVHPTHWLISTQVVSVICFAIFGADAAGKYHICESSEAAAAAPAGAPPAGDATVEEQPGIELAATSEA